MNKSLSQEFDYMLMSISLRLDHDVFYPPMDC